MGDNGSRGEILEMEGFKCGLGWDGGGDRVQWRDNPNKSV